jgi:hypothetical protein
MSKLAVAVSGVLGLAVALHAQEPGDLSVHSAPSAMRLEAGAWDLTAIGGAYVESFGGNDEVMAFGGLDIEYFLMNRLALFAEPLGYSISQLGEDATAFGLNVGLRWYYWQPVEPLSLFVEGGLGIIEADRRVPSPDGTHHNFLEQVGFGARWRIADNIAVLGGLRYQHLSNASIHGSDRNPSIDAFGGYGGLTIEF